MGLSPACIKVAPKSPPINACEELDGRPNHHVIKFHITAASKAQNITCKVIASLAIIPAPIVFATLTPSKAPIHSKTAPNNTACLGDNTFVETIDAIEFAQS